MLGHASVPQATKVGLAIFISLVLAPVLPPLPTVEPASAAGILIGVQQLLIGLAIGFTLRIALTGVEAAGQLIGLQMGLGFAVFFDPQTSAQTAVVGQFLGLFAILTFLSMHGHLMVINALARSFSTLPISAEPVNPGGLRLLADWGGEDFRTGLLISLPVVAALLIANIAVGILTRAAPQLNIFAVGFPLTLAAGFFRTVVCDSVDGARDREASRPYWSGSGSSSSWSPYVEFHERRPRITCMPRRQRTRGSSSLGPFGSVGLPGRSRALCGHLGHARLANRMIYRLRRSSPTCLAAPRESSRVPH